jgi:hypothetical protein
MRQIYFPLAYYTSTLEVIIEEEEEEMDAETYNAMAVITYTFTSDRCK